ncbi:hypothetical protein GINT2_001667 [Glugoides intestinalis]
MSMYTKQLTQKCNNVNCTKAFCRNISDANMIKRITKTLQTYKDSLLCKNINALETYDKKLNGNVIIDSLFYVASLLGNFEGNTTQLSFSEFKSSPVSKINNTPEIAKTQKHLINKAKPCKELNHRYCNILVAELTKDDNYLLIGVLNLLLYRFQKNPDFNLSLIIIRFLRKLSSENSIDETIYGIFLQVFETINEKLMHSFITPFLKNHTCCSVENPCLFYFDFSVEDLTESVKCIVSFIEQSKPTNFKDDGSLNHLFEILKCLYQINERFKILEEPAFVLKKFFSDINLKNELKFYKLKFDSPLNYDFAIPIYIKAEILKLQNAEYMKTSLQDAFFKALFQGITHPYLFINIRRDRMYKDTLKIISEIDNVDVKKQLKVKFIGEEGVDSGGIKKEYFLLIGREIENDVSTFIQTNNRIWFRKGVDLSILQTVGKLVGIALYNDVVLSVPFPSLLFKKLLNIPLAFDDLEEIEPEMHTTFRNMASCTEDDLKFLSQNFTIDIEVHGKRQGFELKKNGANIAVTTENLKEFIELSSLFLMNNAVEDEFTAFAQGFYSIIHFENIQSLSPQELEKILIGIDELDFSSIKKTTTYNGYDEKDAIIEYFWEIVSEMHFQKKRRLIQFITGNDRLAVGGSAALSLLIMKNGCDTDRLPSSQTCFNTLLLPEYTSKAKLKEKLSKAVDMTAGFFLM